MTARLPLARNEVTSMLLDGKNPDEHRRRVILAGRALGSALHKQGVSFSDNLGERFSRGPWYGWRLREEWAGRPVAVPVAPHTSRPRIEEADAGNLLYVSARSGLRIATEVKHSLRNSHGEEYALSEEHLAQRDDPSGRAMVYLGLGECPYTTEDVAQEVGNVVLLYQLGRQFSNAFTRLNQGHGQH